MPLKKRFYGLSIKRNIPVIEKNARRLEKLTLFAAEISKSSLCAAVSVYSVHLKVEMDNCQLLGFWEQIFLIYLSQTIIGYVDLRASRRKKPFSR